ncbi:MAG: ATP synthase F1 subunit gamma [Cytophagales bacterium]
MPSLKEVRNRIKSVSSTQQITKAMKMVAAAKLRRAQDATMKLRPYSLKLSAIISNLTASENNSKIVKLYSEQREVKKVLLVVVTSDRGLCGGFNTNIFKSVNLLLANKYHSFVASGNITLLTIGKKGAEYYAKRNFNVNSKFSSILNGITFSNAKDAADYAMSSFAKGEYDLVEVVYNEFKNVATQVVKTEQFLPLVSSSINLDKKENIDYIYEPDQDTILDELVPKSLRTKFFSNLLESNASEQGARMTAMDKATENAGELLKSLKLTYNRTRQAAITKEILEIVGGAEALNA